MRAALSLIASACILAAGAWADATAETATALQHAYQAAQSVTLPEIHAGLHRTVNCLVGPKDHLFDASQANPCAKIGKGALVDTRDETKKEHLKDAVDMAEMGIAADDVEKAAMLAAGAAGALRQSQQVAATRGR